MKNKTKNKVRITCMILLIVLLQAIGITYAKYITVETGKGRAETAKWAFEMEKNGTQTLTVDLVNTANKSTLVDGKIAPGTSGMIDIVLDATGSEVDVDYTLQFANEQNKPDNLIFSCKGITYNSITEIIESGTIKNDSPNKIVTVTVIWKWDYETGTTNDEKAANNIKDTEYANKNVGYTFDIIATGTQSR